MRPLPRPPLALAIVLVVGLAVRAAYLVERTGAPDFEHPIVDAGWHDDWARTLAFGEERAAEWRKPTLPDPGFAETPYLRPPAFPYALAAVYRVTGGSALAAAVFQMLLGLASVVLAYRIGSRWLGGAVATAFAALMATHWTLVYFEGELHAETLLVALEMAFLLALGRAAEAGRPSVPAAAAGVLLGLATLTRPNVALFLPAAAGWLVWTARRRGGLRRALPPIVALALGTAVAMAPAAARNWRVTGEWIPVTSNLGINLYLGNHEGATGEITGDLGAVGWFGTCYDYQEVVEGVAREVGHAVSHREVSAWFADRALEWIRANPGDAAALTWRKATFFWGPAEVGHNKEVALERRHSAVLRFLPMPFWALLALALFGGALFAALHRGGGAPDGGGGGGGLREEELVVLFALLLVTLFASVLPFFAGARYRVPALPFLMGIAALGVRARGAPGAKVALAGTVAAVVAALSVVLSPEHEPSAAKWHVNRGQVLRDLGRLDAARVELAAALADSPDSALAHFEMAVLLHRTDDLAGARQHYEAVLRTEPDHVEALFNLAFLDWSGGDLAGAEERFRRAEAADPGFALAPYNLGRMYAQTNRPRKAEEAFRRAIAIEPRPEFRDALALHLATAPGPARDPAEALRLADGVVRDTGGGDWRFLATLAEAYAAAGKPADASATMRAAIDGARAAGAPPEALRELQAALERYR